MASLRGWLFDHLGLKLVALLLSVLVYLYVYTEREARLTLTFPLRVTGLADSLAIAGLVPARIEAELVGTGKQLLRLKFLEPAVQLDLEGVRAGRHTRVIGPELLPIPHDGRVRVERVKGPEELTLRVEPRIERRLPAVVDVRGAPAAGFAWSGELEADPESVLVGGARSEVLALAAASFGPVRVDGRRDTVVAELEGPTAGPGLRFSPSRVRFKVPVSAAESRSFAAPVEVWDADGWRVRPETVTVRISAPPAAWKALGRRRPVAHVAVAEAGFAGRVAVRLDDEWYRLGSVSISPETCRVAPPRR